VIKNIVSCGCSWVAGTGCYKEDTERLSSLFAKKYNAKDINLAKEGGSNDRIVRKITNWILGNKNKLDETLFLIGLSEPKRFEIWAERKRGRGEYIWDSELVSNISDISNIKMSNIEDNFHGWDKIIEATLRNIFLLTILFEKYNCKYLIFDSLDNMKKITRTENRYYDEVFGNKNYYTKESWMEFCSPKGKGLFAAEDERMWMFQEGDGLNEDLTHPSAKGNQKWSEVLISYVEENKLW